VKNYQTLPSPPDSVTAAHVLSRLIDSIGYRLHLATNGLTENEIQFRPIAGSMDMTELLKHMNGVLFFAYKSFNPDAIFNREASTFEEYKQELFKTCSAFSTFVLALDDQQVASVTAYLKRNDTTYSFWYLINGPISDILTHIGQINSWRRIAGNPVPRVSPFTGEGY